VSTCPVCSYPGLPDEIEHEICPVCGTHFGYEDFGTSPQELRRRWIEKGAPVFAERIARRERDWLRAEKHAAQADAEREKNIADTLRMALEESVKFQSHYAELLNMWDGGRRLSFANADAWIKRLQAVRRSLSTPETHDTSVEQDSGERLSGSSGGGDG
jgi:DNA repair exonuclease SbcCD ATPase subunit